MIDKDSIKRLVKTGAFIAFQQVAEETLAEMDVRWEGDKDKLVYDVGKRDGSREAMDNLIHKINSYAED